jgi:heme exporter protein D
MVLKNRSAFLTTLNNQTIDRVVTGLRVPIRKLNDDEVKDYLIPTLIAVAVQYCGVSKTSTPMQTFKECSNFIQKNFGGIGINEIPEAFSMAAAGSIDVDITAYYGIFTVVTLGKVLKNYLPFRGKIVQELQRQKEILLEESRQNEREAKNEEARAEICREIEVAIAAAKEGIPHWEHWQDIPHHYAEIAVKNGIINLDQESKEQILATAQKYAFEALQRESVDTNIKSFERKQLMTQIEAIKEGDKSSLRTSTIRIYSKLLLWHFVK